MMTTLTGFCMMITLTFNELNMEKAVRKKLKIINLLKRCVKLHWVLDKSNLVYANSSCKIYLEEVQVQKNSFEPFTNVAIRFYWNYFTTTPVNCYLSRLLKLIFLDCYISSPKYKCCHICSFLNSLSLFIW